ncbi:MAG: hypothetical protein N4A35_08680 [Flavobacteriales bacterium]|jgi:hypothetical protein|nr:hypothetical protein [Flavobacteriales bacterium]
MGTSLNQLIVKSTTGTIIAFFFILFFTAGISAQEKVIKAKPFKVKYTYNEDSITIDRQELKKICVAFTAFHEAISQKDYKAYLNALSERSKTMIPKEKLERKFQKFIGYNVKLERKIELLLISEKGNPQSFETTPSLLFMIKLPQGQTINKRVGFDPVKVKKIKNSENLLGLYLVKEKTAYKVTIPW